MLPDAVPCAAGAPVYFGGQVGAVVDVLSEVCQLFVWMYTTCPAASTLNTVVASIIYFVRKYMISVLVSDTVRLKASHTTMITPMIFLGFSGDRATTPAASA